MNEKIRIKCVGCGKEWEKPCQSDDEDISSSLCRGCCAPIVPVIRGRQKKEGNFDCFAKTNGYCDQFGCSHRWLCFYITGADVTA